MEEGSRYHIIEYLAWSFKISTSVEILVPESDYVEFNSVSGVG